MRILQLTKQVPYPLSSGEAIAIDHTRRCLDSMDVEIFLYSLNPSRQFNHLDQNTMCWLETRYVDLLIENINTDIGLFSMMSNLFFAKSSMHLSRFDPDRSRIITFIEKTKINILWVESLFMMPLALRIKEHSPWISIVYRAHNIEFSIWEQIIPHSSIFKKLYLDVQVARLRHEEIRLINNADAIVFISLPDMHRVTQELVKLENTIVLSTTIPLVRIPRQIQPGGRFVLGFLGDLDWQPNRQGIRWFVKHVLPHLSENIHLTIAGKSRRPYRFESNRIYYRGRVEEVSSFYDSIDAAIVPIFIGSGIRIKVLEAISYGVPIISTELGIAGLGMTAGTHFLQAESIDEWIELLNKTSLDSAYLYDFALNAQRDIGNTSRESDELEAMFTRLSYH